MWLLGHLGLGYIFGVSVEKVTGEKVRIPLVMLCSFLPDLDLLFEPFIIHRGPTHSIIVALALFVPIFLIFRRGLPYFAALASHSLIGDYFQGSEQLFWPISKTFFGASSNLQLTNTTETLVEVILFLIMIVVILWRFQRSKHLNH